MYERVRISIKAAFAMTILLTWKNAIVYIRSRIGPVKLDKK